jgi:hypothetical protein
MRSPQERHQRSGLDRVEAEFLKHLGAAQDIFDLGEDGVSEQQDEPIVPPGIVGSWP